MSIFKFFKKSSATSGKGWPQAIQHEDRVRELLTTGADVEEPQLLGMRPLHMAASLGCVGAVELLISHGANVNATDDQGQTPLHWASGGKDTKQEHLAVITSLIKAGADVNAHDALGSTPLHRAAFFGHPKIVRLLLSQHADDNARDVNGLTPMRMAMENGHQEALDVLARRAARTNVKKQATLEMRQASGIVVDIVSEALHKAAEIDGFAIIEIRNSGNRYVQYSAPRHLESVGRRHIDTGNPLTSQQLDRLVAIGWAQCEDEDHGNFVYPWPKVPSLPDLADIAARTLVEVHGACSAEDLVVTVDR